MRKFLFYLLSIVMMAVAPTKGWAQFTTGNLAIIQASSASANNTACSVVEINTNSSSQSAISTIPVDGSLIRVSGSATSTLYASNSDDGSLFCFTGHNSNNTSSNANTLNPRAVVTINNNGTVSLAATYTGTSGNQTRCATSLNNTNWYIADQGGLYTNGTTAASPSGNFRGIKAFGGNVYVGQQSGTAAVIQVATLSAITGGTATGLPGLTNNSSFQDFYLVSSGANGSVFDLLYILSSTSATAGSITKYSLVAGDWTANGSYNTAFGGFGLAAKTNGSDVYLFVTSGNGGTAANNVIRLTDAGGYNTAINITTGNNITLYTAPSGTTLKGLAFAPVSTASTDVTPPVVSLHKITSHTTSYIVFNEPVTAASATNTVNYSFAPSLPINSATLGVNSDTVFLDHDAIIDGQDYTLTVSSVQDTALNTMTTANFNILYNASVPNLVITEIIHSPNDIESIEIYNAGGAAVNLGGLKWTDGTTGNFPVVSLAAGATAVFATAPATTSSILNVTPVYTINNGLSSSNDILVIRNSLNQVIDSVEYFIGTNGWPTAPSGVYAYSFELNAATNDNSLGNNWAVPLNTVTPQPSQGIVRATMGTYPPAVVTPPNASVSFVGSKTNVNEDQTEVRIIANLQGGGANPSSIDIELLPFATATAGVDFTAPVSLQYNWAASANNVNDTLVFTINNDALPENAEYFTVRFTNPVNIDLPAASVNHFTVFILDDDKQAPVATEQIQLHHLASINNGTPGPNSAEIVAHDAASQRLFIANSLGAKIDIVNFSNPAAPFIIASIPVTPYGNINSIAVRNGVVAVAIENSNPQMPGKVVFLDTNGVFISQVEVGAMPDMITFNHAGTKVLTANEGEPNTSYSADPEGSVSIVDISGGVASVTQANVTTAGFSSYNAQAAALKAQGIRIFGPGATVAQDMEPEYITVSEDDQTAWVTCQENNAIAKIDLNTNTVTEIFPLGTKDHLLGSNALDISDQGGVVQIANWPVKGVYMPDAIASYQVGGQTYLVTANEGDAREYNGFSEVERVSASSYVLDSASFPYPDVLKANIGRLNITTASGDTDGDGDYDEIHAYGGRSISIWNATTGTLVWDSGDDMEMITSKDPVFGAIFNASNANNTFKNRSDDKGPEPEGVTIATIKNKVYAFIALERMGGCMVYDVTNPAAPVFVDYANTRTVASYGGDQGAEGIIYIEPAQSPNGKPIVILANEVSSTLSIFELEGACIADNAVITVNGPSTICPASSVILSANAGSSYQWSNGATTQSINVNLAGNYTVAVTNSFGCVDTSSAQAVTVKTIPTVKIKNLSGLSVCDGNTVPFIIDPTVNVSGFAYQWKLDGNPISGANDSTYNATTSGAYALTVSGGTGCEKTSAVKNVTVKSNPVANFTAGGPTEFCAGGAVTLQATVIPDYIYVWLKDGVSSGSGVSKSFKKPGNYSLVAKLKGCTDTSSAIPVTVYPLPIASVVSSNPTLFCAGDSTLLEAAPASNNFSYEWKLGANVIAGTTGSAFYGYTTGNYKVVITDSLGCISKASASLKLTAQANPTATITAIGSTTIALNGSVKLRANGSVAGGHSWQWYLDGVLISGATGKDYIATEGGDYTVVVTKGICSATSAAKTVNQLAVKESNAIVSGNGMQQNLVELAVYPNPVSSILNFSVRGLEIVDAIIQVMDMNGKLVASKEIKEASATIDMTAYPNGIYLIRFNDKNGAFGNIRIIKQ